jgi:hypothetical protein
VRSLPFDEFGFDWHLSEPFAFIQGLESTTDLLYFEAAGVTADIVISVIGLNDNVDGGTEDESHLDDGFDPVGDLLADSLVFGIRAPAGAKFHVFLLELATVLGAELLHEPPELILGEVSVVDARLLAIDNFADVVFCGWVIHNPNSMVASVLNGNCFVLFDDPSLVILPADDLEAQILTHNYLAIVLAGSSSKDKALAVDLGHRSVVSISVMAPPHAIAHGCLAQILDENGLIHFNPSVTDLAARRMNLYSSVATGTVLSPCMLTGNSGSLVSAR